MVKKSGVRSVDTKGNVRGTAVETPLRVFIGFDPRQPVSYNVLQQSIAIRSTKPVAITPLIFEQLPLNPESPHLKAGLTPFTWSRFLVPWLCNYEGLGLFLDADMLVLDDIAELFSLHDGSAVMYVDNVPFERAALMLFDCGHDDNKMLTPDYLNGNPEGLHKIGWTESKGQLPHEWNHCVFYDEPKEGQKLVHFTSGIPVFDEIQGCEYTEEYGNEVKYLNHADPWISIMGRSVHVDKVFRFNVARTLQDFGLKGEITVEAKSAE